MPDQQNDLIARLALLEAENASLRGQSTPAETPVAPPPPSKMDVLLGKLIEQAKELALPNNPAGDAIAQTAGRTQALAKVVESLVNAFGAAVGGMGGALGGLSEQIGAVRSEVEALKISVAAGATALPSEESQGQSASAQELVEVDNTGAPEPPAPVVSIPHKPVNGRRAPQRPAAVAQAPSQVTTPSGMPAEVAQLQGVPSAAIASVTVKP